MPPRRSASGPMTAADSKSSTSNTLTFIPPPNPPSPIVSKLRKMWQFAIVCQFMHTFDEAFGISGFETESLERDLDGIETAVIPDLMRRLLYTLTLDRRVSIENWQDKTRNQFLKRNPENNPMGTFEEPISWEELPLTQKVEILRAACEWHFHDSERFRKLVKSEEDAESWRIEPIGWDSKGNTYWLFDDNRLWIQYAPPPSPEPELPPASKGTKRARAEARRAAAAARKSHASTNSRGRPKSKSNSNQSSSSRKRPRPNGAQNGDEEEEEDGFEDVLDDDSEDDDHGGRSKKRLRTRTRKAAPLPRRNASRIAATDATRNIKRNAIENSATMMDLQSSPRRNGTRTSRRLKGSEEGSDDEWEAIPDELLKEGRQADGEEEEENDDESLSDAPSGEEQEVDKDQDQDDDQDEEMDEDDQQEESVKDPQVTEAEKESAPASGKIDVNGDSTMLDLGSDTNVEKKEDESNQEKQEGEDASGDSNKMEIDVVKSEEKYASAERGKEREKSDEEKRKEAEDEVEFETVAVTLIEWDSIITRFSQSKDPDEKNLFKFLKEEIYPRVTKELAEAEKARAAEILLASRKRSSRIAIKESEKEEKERDRNARLSMEERMSGVRAEEEEKVSKEELTKQREIERERKVKEREERALAREKEAYEKARFEEMEKIRKENERAERQRRRDEFIANGGDLSTFKESSSPAPSTTTPAASTSNLVSASSNSKKGPRESSTTENSGNAEVGNEVAVVTEDWKVACEICGTRGINIQDHHRIVCCEGCKVWQHTKCWNHQDRRNGQEELRNWSQIDFYCSKCKPPQDEKLMPPYPNSKPLPEGWVLQKLKKNLPKIRKSVTKDGKEEDGKGKEKEKETPKEKKPRAPRKPRDSNASNASTSSTSSKVSANQVPGQGQGAPHFQGAPQPLPAGSNGAPIASPDSSASSASQTWIQLQVQQQPSAPPPPPANLTLGSLPPPFPADANATDGLGSAFVQHSAQSPSLNGAILSSPGAPTLNGSNSNISPRSPSSYSRSNQPSGSFPIRRDAPAKSPLSRPYDSPIDVPPLTIGRAQSPTPTLGHSRNGSGSSGSNSTIMTPLQRGIAASSNPNSSLNSSPSQQGVNLNGDRNSLYQRQAAPPSPSAMNSQGPGPSHGSLARTRMPSDPSRQFGPSPPRQPYGSGSDQSSSMNGNVAGGSMAPPLSRPTPPPSTLNPQAGIQSNQTSSQPLQAPVSQSIPQTQQQQQQQQSTQSNPPPS